MSEKIFAKVEFDNEFDINDEFVTFVMNYAIPLAINDLNSYWRSEDAEKIVKDSTFAYIWKSFPDVREDLLRVAGNICDNKGGRNKGGLSEEFCKKFISNMYSLIEENENVDDNKLRVRLLSHIGEEFDYLSEMCKYSLEEDKEQLYNIWYYAGMRESKDPSFYDYAWSKVKRKKGAVDVKLSILEAANNNDAISDILLKKIAKSSPKNIKRSITQKFAGKIRDLRWTIKRLEKDTESPKPALLSLQKKEVDELERKIMLFVDCTDREVVSNLLDCVSKDNLPWLMPSASKHPYLSRRLQQMVDSDDIEYYR
jgi:hypothetical protein